MGVGAENNMHICTLHVATEHIQLNLGQKCQFSKIAAEKNKSDFFAINIPHHNSNVDGIVVF